MSTINPGFGRLLGGTGGALLIVSLFLPWADSLDGASRNGWELSRTSDVFFVIVGMFGIAAATTGGRFGFFRPDLSLNAAADILGVVATIVLGWLIPLRLSVACQPRAGRLRGLDRGDHDRLWCRRFPGEVVVSEDARPGAAHAIVRAAPASATSGDWCFGRSRAAR